ncbi:hypothetical protein [uncultured Kordia sp.]|uniref:hypothetical protein n=1 Tax=uncultured Kordia sp. TaxID=507699 RepID=UPI00262EB655|nr:hypothetical protein [uncultured Kordia sp.]
MSYNIITKNLKNEVDEIPISTNTLFHEYWLPLFEKHKCKNLLNWKYPHDLEANEIQEIIKEWKRLIPFIQKTWEKERANFILKKLKEINYDDYQYISFG